MTKTVSVADDFSLLPFGRYPEHGPDNGQRFRDEYVAPALRAGEQVEVRLTGARGLGPSFLEESFGGLIRLGFTLPELRNSLVIVSETDPSLADECWGYVEEAAARTAATH